MKNIGRWIAEMIPGKHASATTTEAQPPFWVNGRQETIPPGGARNAISPDGRQEAIPPGGARNAISPGGRQEAIPSDGVRNAIPPGGGQSALLAGTESEISDENPDESREGWLQYHENGLLVRIYLHEGITRVGRSKRMDFSVNGPTVSRAHAEFVRRDHHYYVRDTNSTCGTYLNGNAERIDGNREFELHPKDEVRLGNVKMIFLLREMAGHAETPRPEAPEADARLVAARA